MRVAGGRDYAWAAFSIGMLALLVASVLDVLWGVLVDGNWWGLVLLPIAILFYWWWGVGAWRRTVWARVSGDGGTTG
jgi:hypothetical protein